MGHTFIHDRYGSKEAFWKTVVERAIGQVTDAVVAALAAAEAGDDLARLTASVRAFHQAAARHPQLGRVIDYEACRDPRAGVPVHTSEPGQRIGAADLRPSRARGHDPRHSMVLFHFAVTKPLAMYGQVPWRGCSAVPMTPMITR